MQAAYDNSGEYLLSGIRAGIAQTLAAMDPYDKYNAIFYKFIGPYGAFVGVNMTDPKYRPTLLTFFWLGVNLSAFAAIIYTIAVGNAEDSNKCVMFLGLGIQGLTKYCVLIYYCRDICDKVQLLERIYLANRDRSSRAYQILVRWSHYCLLFAKYGAIPVVGSIVFISAWPFGMWLWTGVLEFIVPVYIPFVSVATTLGFLVTFVYHGLLMLLAASGTCGADFMIVILVLHLWPMCLIWAHMFQVLNAVLERRAEAAKRIAGSQAEVDVKIYLRNIILTHKLMCNYMKSISTIYFWMFLAEIFTCAQCLISILFCLSTLTWYPLYMFFVMFLSKLLAYCCLGTISETSTDHVYNTLLMSNWYLLPVLEQKYLLLMIFRAQNPTMLKAGTMPLNLNTFVSVMKTVYSVGMLLAGG